jgi:L-alanine-DL-glutamate epimerase-like enolase superfamily enzyme
MTRRTFMRNTALGAGAAGLPLAGCRPVPPSPDFPEALTTITTPFLGLESRFTDPVRLERIECRTTPNGVFCRVTDSDGATGCAAGNERQVHLNGILQHLVAPAFLGQDARRLEHLVDEAYRVRSNYKLAGLALNNCIALVELAIWDLLARKASLPVHALLGPQLRHEIPAYLTRLTRSTTAAQEVEQVLAEMERTGARAVKVKIGGRMSGNADASPGRTEALIPALRQALQDKTIYVDSNGSYDAPTAIRIGRMLEAHGVAFFEEPCPFEEFEATRAVADTLDIPVAGGEQDTSLPLFSWMIRHRALDLVQPDLLYAGGMIRTLRVARMARAAGLPVIPHAPGTGFKTIYQLHFAAVTPNLGAHLEQSPHPGFRDGLLRVPEGPGWGSDEAATDFAAGTALFDLRTG